MANHGRWDKKRFQLPCVVKILRMKVDPILSPSQEVFHVHLHVFPRFAGDGFSLHPGPNYTNLPTRTELDALARGIRAQMAGNSP